MESPLLKSRGKDKEEDTDIDNDETNSDKGVCRGIFHRITGWFFSKPIPTNAETVLLLTQLITDINLALALTEKKSTAKKLEAAKMKASGKKAEMAMVWATAKMYDKRYTQLVGAREVATQVREEISSMQNNMVMFKSFTRANDVLGRMAKQMKIEDVESVIGELREQIEQGKEISEALGAIATEEAMDQEEAERELEAFVNGQERVIPVPDQPSPQNNSPPIGEFFSDKTAAPQKFAKKLKQPEVLAE